MFEQLVADGRAVIALVATHDRCDLLFSRAIPSILRQTRRPDRLIMVVDRSKSEMSDSDLEALGARLKAACGDLRATILRNVRTQKRAAGAWNTGIDHMHRDAGIMENPEGCFIAILDDDDAWEADHLESCLDVASKGQCGMVVSGLIRHDTPEDAGRRQSIPQTLDAREQFIRGQHIQGSNLFVRLDLLLKAGLFDEHLPSCTDRDLCIRLAVLPSLRFGCTNRHTVHHFADPRPDRLSTPASSAKTVGLNRFWRKHVDHFDEEARVQAAGRARDHFGWVPHSPEGRASNLPPRRSATREVSMVAGFVTDAVPREHVCGLLDDLLRLATAPGIAKLRVVVVENGPLPSDGERPLATLVEQFGDRGLDVELVTIERQHEDWARGRLVDTPDSKTARLPIAVTRTILNTYVVRAASDLPGAWAWILDDDKRLQIRVDCGNGVTVTRLTPDIAALCERQDAGVDIVIGPDTAAAPLPFTATVRMQLVDLDHFLGVLAGVGPQARLPDRTGEDDTFRALLPDHYYDLSKTTEHLETPLSVPQDATGATAGDALASIARRCERIRGGESVFRPLQIPANDLNLAKASVQRGGSTIFFNPAVLMEYPQTLAKVGEQFVRRSDMLVTQLMRDQQELRIEMHPAAGVLHDRSTTTPVTLDEKTLREDVLGYALYRSADEVMQKRTPTRRREPLLAWDAAELDEAVRLFGKYVTERLASLTLSSWRIVGLAESIQGRIAQLSQESSPWASSEHCRSLGEIQGQVNQIVQSLAPAAIAKFAAQIQASVSEADIRATFLSMDGLIGEYRATFGAGSPEDPQWQQTRERRSRAILETAYGVTSLTCLGSGGEGVVFTDGTHVYKVLDLLKRRPNHDTLAMLNRYRKQSAQARHLYPLSRVDVRDGVLLVVYPFEPSEPYVGGRGPELLGLLRECKARGIVFRNMHPKNLRVSASGLKLIDYGSDIRAFTEEGYRSMAERACLSWRWAHRTDLDELMRRAITDKTLPELDGFARFWTALQDERPSATEIVAEMVDGVLGGVAGKRVLDYGCGKKAWSARRFAESGAHTVGYDPGANMATRWADVPVRPANLTLTADRTAALAQGPFDVVICSLVLCELGDGSEYEQVLTDLGSAARKEGMLVITLCDPFATFGGPTPLHRRRDIPEGMTYEDAFWYVENAETGVGRREFHRPLARVERDLLRHGIAVERRIQNRTVDTERFEPASDFMMLVCRSISVPNPECKVSLLIKTCAMEAATIERQVTHLVSQLEGPRTFDERVLVIDSRRDGFVRQHAASDWEAVVRAAERLVKHGIIDRIDHGPPQGSASRRVMVDWFGVDSEASHSCQGAPLTAPLRAIEWCSGEYILQVDSDLLICRSDRSHDYLGEMIAAYHARPLAVTVSLSIVQGTPTAFSTGDQTPWRVEARGCLFHKARLLAARPFPNEMENGAPRLSWHRSMDRAVALGRCESLRGGGAGAGFIHPPNTLKRSIEDWMLLMDRVEKGEVPQSQGGQVELVGEVSEWIPGMRSEPFIFVITGRNVSPGRAARCLESITAQRLSNWGAVVVDDGSSAFSREALELATKPWRDRITLLAPRERRGQLANMILAIRHVCTDPDSIIVTLDLDDALIGTDVLSRLDAEYRDGADVTVGSMLRTDKDADYPVSFDDPRQARGGNVWQHLRSFRKRLFDAIPDDHLKVNGRYVDIAVDWAFMIPIMEMAQSPVWIRERLYLYEPSGLGKGADRAEREKQIAAIIAKPSCRPVRPRTSTQPHPLEAEQ